MGMTSAEASSIIDNALLAQNANATVADPATESGIMPGPLPTDVSADDATKKPIESKEDAKIRQAQQDLLGKEAAQKLQDEQEAEAERQKTLIGLAERAWQSGKDAANTANIRIGGIPTPGNLVVPLVLLLFFVFILITFNGHTRLQWLWLVLTNNAYITPSIQTGQADGQTGNGGPDTTVEGVMNTITVASHTGGGIYGEPYS